MSTVSRNYIYCLLPVPGVHEMPRVGVSCVEDGSRSGFPASDWWISLSDWKTWDKREDKTAGGHKSEYQGQVEE